MCVRVEDTADCCHRNIYLICQSEILQKWGKVLCIVRSVYIV